jgi:hypothetical protein
MSEFSGCNKLSLFRNEILELERIKQSLITYFNHYLVEIIIEYIELGRFELDSFKVLSEIIEQKKNEPSTPLYKRY